MTPKNIGAAILAVVVAVWAVAHAINEAQDGLKWFFTGGG